MWFKPKGWKNLSEEDQAWLKSVRNLSKIQKLRAAVKDDRPERILFLLNAYSFTRQQHYQTARLAVFRRQPKALRTILGDINGFNFSDSGAGDREGAVKLFQSVAPDDVAVWKTLCAFSGSDNYGHLGNLDIISLIPPNASRDILRHHLDDAPASSSGVFRQLVRQIGLQSAEDLKFILAWTEKFSAAHGVLDAVLTEAAGAGDSEKVALLLEKKADPNFSGGIALLNALGKDAQEVVNLLLPHMDLEACGENLLNEAREKRFDAAKIEWLEKTVHGNASALRLRKNQENCALVDDDTLAETKLLPSGMTLTTLFNFRSRQQVLIVEGAGEKKSLAVTVKDFSEVGDQDFLEAMRLKLVALGGKADTVTRLPKPSLGKG